MTEPAAPPDETIGVAEVGPEPTLTTSLWFNVAKLPGQGEDSDPILHVGADLSLVGVFDGMGGAGGTVYQTADGPRTGAYLASRVARDAVERHLLDLELADDEVDGPRLAEYLRTTVERALADRLVALNAPPSRLRSSLLRALPTTMALALLQRRGLAGQAWTCHVFWSGDSRVYLLTPESGLHQITVDDIRDQGDAMMNLREDSLVSNAMSADTAFVIHHHRIDLTPPFLLVAATDGCFGYWQTPMHFERLLLSTLMDSSDEGAWSASLQHQIVAVTGDDAAAAILGVGADHAGFRQLLASRSATVEESWVRELDEITNDIAHLERSLTDLRRRWTDTATASWSSYRPGYERYLARTQSGETLS